MIEATKHIYNLFSKHAVKICIACNFTSAKLSIFNHLITCTLGCWCFSRGEYIYGLLGLGICFINGFIDYLDGDVARATQTLSRIGAWLDSGADVIVQNVVMGAIAIGCYKQGLNINWVVMFFVGNCANNWVSFNYNQTFGFDSDKGNSLFRRLMDRKCHLANRIIKSMIDPTGNYFSLAFYTYRYWIMAGMIFNCMPNLFQIVTVISNAKWAVMYVIYALYQSGEHRLFVIKALSALDDEKEDFYSLRHN